MYAYLASTLTEFIIIYPKGSSVVSSGVNDSKFPVILPQVLKHEGQVRHKSDCFWVNSSTCCTCIYNMTTSWPVSASIVVGHSILSILVHYWSRTSGLD